MYGLWKNSTVAVSLALALGAIPAVAGVKVDNMIYNNAMYSSGVNGEFPDGWSAVYHKVMPQWKKSADGKSRSVLFVNHGENAASSDVRAFSSLYIQPGEQYRFRVKIRTKGVTRGRLSFVAFAPGWNGSFGIEKTLPENSDWITLDEVHTASTGRGNIYSFALYLSGFKGEVEIAAPEVLPESEKAIANAYYVSDVFPVLLQTCN